MRGKFDCNLILDPFIEQDLKFKSFGNLGLNYSLVWPGNSKKASLTKGLLIKGLFIKGLLIKCLFIKGLPYQRG